MPSPIAHLSVGYIIYRFFRRRLDRKALAVTGSGFILLAVCLFFSMMPDMDAALGFATGNMGHYHNQWTHSILFGLMVCAGAALFMHRWKGASFTSWFAMFFCAYGSHILMDYFTYGRGVRLLWPVDPSRYRPAQSFFGGLHWSDGFIAKAHIYTAIEELSFAAIIIGLYIAVEIVVDEISKRSFKRK